MLAASLIAINACTNYVQFVKVVCLAIYESVRKLIATKVLLWLGASDSNMEPWKLHTKHKNWNF